MFTHDPSFGVTSSCESALTFIDGDKGILLHRGYPIEQLAKKSNFLVIGVRIVLFGSKCTHMENHVYLCQFVSNRKI